jgi:hypothetical protein
VDEHPTVIELMVIHEVPIIEVTMIELPTSKSGSTMEGATGKTPHMATRATDMTTAYATRVGAESPIWLPNPQWLPPAANPPPPPRTGVIVPLIVPLSVVLITFLRSGALVNA